MHKALFIHFLIVFKVSLAYAEYPFTQDYTNDCGQNRSGVKILNCQKDEDCSGKYVIYDKDIICAFLDVYNINPKKTYDLSLYNSNFTEKEKEDVNKSYVEYIYTGNRSEKNIYRELINGEFVNKRSVFCSYRSMEDILDENGIQEFLCIRFDYKIDGKEVKFNNSLRGIDPVYDWVMDNMPKNRKKSKYINFGHDYFNEAIQ